MAAMKTIWTEAKAEYHGEFVDFDSMAQWPKPVQRPASAGDRRRGLSLGRAPGGGLWRWLDADRWAQPGRAGNLLPRFRQIAAEAGARPGQRIPVTLFGVAPDGALLDRAEAAERCPRRLHAAVGGRGREPEGLLDGLVEKLRPRL